MKRKGKGKRGRCRLCNKRRVLTKVRACIVLRCTRPECWLILCKECADECR